MGYCGRLLPEALYHLGDSDIHRIRAILAGGSNEGDVEEHDPVNVFKRISALDPDGLKSLALAIDVDDL